MAAVVPEPDGLRLNAPKAYVALRPGVAPDTDTARALFVFCRQRMAPYQRIRALEFSDLPKTRSGKIRRVELRARAATLEQSKSAYREFELGNL